SSQRETRSQARRREAESQMEAEDQPAAVADDSNSDPDDLKVAHPPQQQHLQTAATAAVAEAGVIAQLLDQISKLTLSMLDLQKQLAEVKENLPRHQDPSTTPSPPVASPSAHRPAEAPAV